jgi:predicted nucleotidyltransferase component of viral defense system
MTLDRLQARLKAYQQKTHAPWHIIELDYVIFWILLGISKTPTLHNNLTFKGGTALRKAYFENYRFSEDLDFTASPLLPKGNPLFLSIKESCKTAQASMSSFIEPLKMEVHPLQKGKPHPEGQEAFIIKTQFPWHREPLTTIIIEITFNEEVIAPNITRSIFHPYGEPLTCTLSTYCLEEIIAEKLRAILQNTKKLHEKRWARSRARDYYDIWYILKHKKNELNIQQLPSLLQQKCTLKNVYFKSYEQFFDPDYLEEVEKTWSEWLGLLVSGLPTFQEVIGYLKTELKAICEV